MEACIFTLHLKKAGFDERSLSNYRPVSNLSFLSKVLERIINFWLTAYLTENNLLQNCHLTYRRGHSTETAALKIFSDIIDEIANGKFALLSLLDLTAAFDAVDHFILLLRLEITFNFSDVILQWICSYYHGHHDDSTIGNHGRNRVSLQRPLASVPTIPGTCQNEARSRMRLIPEWGTVNIQGNSLC